MVVAGQIAIRSDRCRVGVLPGAGASLEYGRVRTSDGQWRDLLRPTEQRR